MRTMLPPSFNIKATNIELTGELRDYLVRRFSSLVGILNFQEPTLKVQIEVGRTTRHHGKGDVYRAEFNVRQRGGLFRAVSERADVRAAIDEARDALETEIGRAKTRRLSFVRRSHRALKEIVRGFYGAGMRFVRVPKFKLPRFRFKIPRLKWRWWEKK